MKRCEVSLSVRESVSENDPLSMLIWPTSIVSGKGAGEDVSPDGLKSMPMFHPPS
jgi:hypothetical protein